MSLVHFHRFLIATAIVFCLGYGAWELNGAAGAGFAEVAEALLEVKSS